MNPNVSCVRCGTTVPRPKDRRARCAACGTALPLFDDDPSLQVPELPVPDRLAGARPPPAVAPLVAQSGALPEPSEGRDDDWSDFQLEPSGEVPLGAPSAASPQATAAPRPARRAVTPLASIAAPAAARKAAPPPAAPAPRAAPPTLAGARGEARSSRAPLAVVALVVAVAGAGAALLLRGGDGAPAPGLASTPPVSEAPRPAAPPTPPPTSAPAPAAAPTPAASQAAAAALAQAAPRPGGAAPKPAAPAAPVARAPSAAPPRTALPSPAPAAPRPSPRPEGRALAAAQAVPAAAPRAAEAIQAAQAPAAIAPVAAPVAAPAAPAPAPPPATAMAAAAAAGADPYRRPRTVEPACIQGALRLPRDAGTDGAAIRVRFSVGLDGRPAELTFLDRPSDFRVERAIREAIQGCRFVPGTDGRGAPSVQQVVMPFRFDSR